MFYYWSCCVEMDGDDVNAMRDRAVGISYLNMRRKCVDLLEWAKAHGYDRSFPLSKDFHVAYYRSELFGEQVCYLVWSGIEFVFRTQSNTKGYGYGSKPGGVR